MNGPAAEADDGLIGPQRRANEPHRLEHRRERLLGIGHAQALDVGHGADRLVDHRPDALDEPDVDPHPEHRGHDVREHHGRVDVVAAHRLQGHLRAQLGRMGDIEECVLLADGAIFRKRPARLAHEPHRGPLDFLAPRGAHEKRLAHPTRVAPIVNLVGEHRVTTGPLAPRWLAWSLESPRAGTTATARVSLENAGSATWRSHGTEGVQASFHWLDPLGNPIVWDGPRTPLAHAVGPGERIELELEVTAPRPPGPYRLAFDLVEENRFWFAEVGGTPLELEIEVAPRIDARTLAVEVHGTPDPATSAALAAQEEPLARAEHAAAVAHLVAGAIPPPEWSRLVLDAHVEGWAAVGTALIATGRDRELEPWRGGGGRNPRFDRPLLLPSLLAGIEPTTHLGLPAYAGDDGLFDGRVAVTLPRRSGRRPT